MKSSLPLTPRRNADEVHYPESDDKPMAETGIHVLLLINLIARLRNFFHGQRVYVIGNMYLYWHEGKPKKRRAPDVMVVKDVDPTIARRTFKTWEEGAVPCFILEATSASTVDIDLEVKHDLYEEIGVKEYFLFDPLNEGLPVKLCGFRLVDGEYEELTPAADGSLYSEELRLTFIPHGTELLVIDPKTGERLPTPEEAHEISLQLQKDTQLALDHWAEVKQQLAEAQWKVQEAWQEAERAKRDKELLANEVERLKKLLQDQGHSNGSSPAQP